MHHLVTSQRLSCSRYARSPLQRYVTPHSHTIYKVRHGEKSESICSYGVTGVVVSCGVLLVWCLAASGASGNGKLVVSAS